MGFWVGSQDALVKALNDLKQQIADLTIERDAVKKERSRHEELLGLREQIETLKIEKARIEEEQARRERDVRHEVGLLRKQTQVEQDLAKKEAILTVRQENLDADRKRFEEQMKFTTARFEKEVGYLHDTIGQVLKRLPVIEVDLNHSSGSNGHRKEEVEA